MNSRGMIPRLYDKLLLFLSVYFSVDLTVKGLFQLIDRHKYHGLSTLVEKLPAGNDDSSHFLRNPFTKWDSL